MMKTMMMMIMMIDDNCQLFFYGLRRIYCISFVVRARFLTGRGKVELKDHSKFGLSQVAGNHQPTG